jgi:hypothetical protein
METPWLQSGTKSFVRPCDIALNDLPTGYEKLSAEARALADKLGMKKSEEQEAIALITRGDARKQKFAEYIMNASDEEMAKFERLIPKHRELSEFKSFKEGIQNLHRIGNMNSDDRHELPSAVSNPDRYLRNSEESVREAMLIHREGPRVVAFSVTRNVASNKLAREFLEQEYNGNCQVTGKTFQKRTAGNYFEALSLVGRLDAEYLNDAGNMLCLCPDMVARFMHGHFEWIDSVEEKILAFRAEKEGGTINMRQVTANVAGDKLTITWSERHFIKLCALWSNAL